MVYEEHDSIGWRTVMMLLRLLFPPFVEKVVGFAHHVAP